MQPNREQHIYINFFLVFFFLSFFSSSFHCISMGSRFRLKTKKEKYIYKKTERDGHDIIIYGKGNKRFLFFGYVFIFTFYLMQK